MISLSGLFENLLLVGPLLMLILMPAGLIASAWVTNTVYDYFRKDIDESTSLDRFGTLALLVLLFGSYCYVMITLFDL
jgi:hypothetical protein